MVFRVLYHGGIHRRDKFILASAIRSAINVIDRDLESDRDMEHESDTDCPLINKRYLNNKHSN